MVCRPRLHSVLEGPPDLQTFLGCFKLSTGCNIIGALLLTAGIASLVGSSTVIEEGGKGWGAVFVYSYTNGIVANLLVAELQSVKALVLMSPAGMMASPIPGFAALQALYEEDPRAFEVGFAGFADTTFNCR